MNRRAVFAVELYKQKTGVMWWLVLGGPLLVAAMIFIDLSFRYDYLLTKSQNAGLGPWGVMMGEVVYLWAMFLPIGITLIAAIVHYREFSENVWKHLLSLPVTRCNVYLSKWLLIVLFTYLAIIVLVLGLFISGKLLGFSALFDFNLYGKYMFYQAMGALGIISFQHWLSSWFQNVMIPIAVGVGLSVCAIYLGQSEALSFFPHATILYSIPFEDVANNRPVWSGLIVGTLLLMLGIVEFQKRDIV